VTDDAASRVSMEATGETVGEAKWRAMHDLERALPQLDRRTVEFQVVSEGERGLLGVGYAPARVIASGEPGAQAAAPDRDESELATQVRGIVERVTGAIGAGTRVEIVEDDERLVATCSDGDLGLLIGKHGQTIDALQHVVNAAIRRGRDGAKLVVVDAADYRARRRETLEAIADRAAARAVAGERVQLEPMTASERRIVHERLKELPGIETGSEGAEPNRYVVVFPA
jgi:spoIIIJ-associated protein